MPIKRKKKVEERGDKHYHKKSQGLFSNLKEKIANQEEKIKTDKKKQFIFFLLGFVFFYLLLTAVALIIPSTTYKEITGGVVQVTLGVMGQNTNSMGLVECTESNWVGLETKDYCYSFEVNGKTILISWLCTGILEIIVLISAILASFGVEWNKKIIGAIVAIILGAVFNILRIVVTIFIILSQNIQTTELAHDLLFRIILFIYIVGVYVLWFNWAVKEKK